MKHSGFYSSGNGAVFVKGFVEERGPTSLNTVNLWDTSENWGRLSDRLSVFCSFLSLCLENNCRCNFKQTVPTW